MTTPPAPIRRDALHAALSLDREPYLMLAQAVLAWSEPHEALRPRDCEQIARQLADHARAVADDVRHCCAALPKNSAIRALTEIVLGEAERRLSVPPRPTVTGVQNLARLLRALYERHNRLHHAPQPSHAALPA
ncbi:restriction endonuclease [Streptomyces sp. NPDC045456]|uniref:restriction endonuclease n=1 Tax=Streptomyces sp. NPDC045456 TaxID=3155254 RepID=UPI0033E83BFB